MAEITSEIQDYVIKNRDMFEDVQKTHDHDYGRGTVRAGEHSVINYTKILDEMIKYLRGYSEYKTAGNKQYKHKVLQSTYSFYNAMFDTESDKYRKKLPLSKFPELNYEFVRKSKELNSLIKSMKRSVDNEVLNLAKVTEKQYKKLAKVNKDDMMIYMWLTTNITCPPNVRAYYMDSSTPVMHKLKKEGR